jgi:hypothetical protein
MEHPLYSVPSLTADSVRQFMERSASVVSRRKDLVIREAENLLLKALTKLGFAGQRVVKPTESDLKYDAPSMSFTGTLKMYLKAIDGQGEKEFSLPVDIKANKVELPVEKVVKEAVKVPTTFDKVIKPALEAQQKEFDKRLKEEIAFGEQKFGEAIKKIEKKDGVEKRAYSPTPYGELAQVLRLSSALLPESLEKGDVIYVEGNRYRLVSKNEANMKADDAGAYFVFELLHPSDGLDEPIKHTWNI